MHSEALIDAPSVRAPLLLHPFRGLRFAASRIGDPASARAFARPYRAVPGRLRDWERRGLLQRDAEPALYLHEYTAGGLTVRGIVGALDLSRRARARADRAVWPHEGVHPEQAHELASRMAEMGMNPAPILLAHQGRPELRELVAATRGEAPDDEFDDGAGQHHRLWSITADDEIAAFQRALVDAQALIADGHHRYAAYVRLQELHPGTPWDRGLAMLVDQADTPLFLGAIHRRLTGVDQATLVARALELGARVVDVDAAAGLAHLAPDVVVLTDRSRWSVLAPPPHPDRAAVEWFHADLLANLGDTTVGVSYHHTVEDALGRLTDGAVAALMPSPGFAHVMRVVRRGLLLPEKATSFQPKPHLGVLMRSVRDEPAERS